MKTTVNRISGVTAVLGGLYLLILSLIQTFYGSNVEDTGLFWQVLPLLSLFLVMGAVGIWALADGHLGIKVGVLFLGLGALITALGFGMMVWFENENGWAVMMLGLLLQPLGFLLFGLFNWRVSLLGRWNWLPFLVGVICCLLFLLAVLAAEAIGFTEQQTELAFGIYLLTLALGWIFSGVNMLIGGQDTAVHSTAAA